MMSSAWLSVLAKIRVLGSSLRPGKISGQLSSEGADDGADLVGVHNRAVKLRRRILFVLGLCFPSAGAGFALAPLDKLLRPQRFSAFGMIMRFDEVNLVAYIDFVGNGLLRGCTR